MIKAPFILAYVLLIAAPLAADQIVLRSEATATGPVRLMDVAALIGPEAKRMSEAIVGPAGTTVLTMDGVRDALAPYGPKWSELIFKGSMRIKLTASKVTPKTENTGASSPASDGAKSADTGILIKPDTKLSSPKTVRQHMADWMRVQAGVDQTLMIRFEKPSDPLLSRDVGSKRLDLQVLGRQRLGKLTFRVRLYDQDRLDSDGRVTATVHAEQNVVVAVRSLQQGRPVSDADVRLEKRWIDSSYTRPANQLDRVVGKHLIRGKRVGDILQVTDVRAPILIKRGARVVLRYFNGPLIIQSSVRATENGEKGQYIVVENEESKRKVTARVTGPQEVTIVAESVSTSPSPIRKRLSP
jgi:flagella basal body P-ring formation protein FlgA